MQKVVLDGLDLYLHAHLDNKTLSNWVLKSSNESEFFKNYEIWLELFEKSKNPIFSINFRVRQLKLKIAKVNLK